MVDHHLVYGSFPINEWAGGKEEVVPTGGVAFPRLHGPPPLHVKVGVVLRQIVVGGLERFAIDLRGVEVIGLIFFVVGRK